MTLTKEHAKYISDTYGLDFKDLEREYHDALKYDGHYGKSAEQYFHGYCYDIDLESRIDGYASEKFEEHYQ